MLCIPVGYCQFVDDSDSLAADARGMSGGYGEELHFFQEYSLMCTSLKMCLSILIQTLL